VPLLRQFLPENIRIIGSGSAVARQTKEVMIKNNLLNNDTTKINLEFYTNGSKEIMANLMSWDKSIIKYLYNN
jgi:glutamate racemase